MTDKEKRERNTLWDSSGVMSVPKRKHFVKA